jgi:1-acyl-sn-glycerol-3-phosphate acyltransferase
MRRLLSWLNLIFTTIVLALIALAIAPFDPKGERLHAIGRLWARASLRCAGIAVSLEGAETLSAPPYLFMANHQSGLDIPVLLAAMPLPFKFVAKRELFRIPLFGWAIKKAGHISIDRENPRKALKGIEEAVSKLAAGASVLIFPEGTRSKDGSLLPFMKGAFSLAARAAAPVVPMAITGTYALQPPGHAVPRASGRVWIHMGKPIPIEGKGLSYKAELMEEVRRSIEGLKKDV